MNFDQPLIAGTLVKRYKRFLADVLLDSGETITAHCPNSGSMMGLKEPGIPVRLSLSDNPKRKLAYTLEMVQINNTWVGVNTQRPNHIVEAALKAGKVPSLQVYKDIRREVVYKPGTRLDLKLEQEGLPPCFVEVKNVTLKEGDLALFPDAVTARGLKHLESLMDIVREGLRAVGFFLVQRDDCTAFDVATAIDPAYADAFQKARMLGVEIICYTCHVTPNAITLSHPLPLIKDN
jgi:sugar fermentation stimulation protein A